MSGGMSHIVSFKAAHNALRAGPAGAAPAPCMSLSILIASVSTHPDDVMTTHHALFEADGDDVLARLSKFQVINGQVLANEPLDDAGAAALDALEEAMNAPGMDVSFQFQPGQIQISEQPQNRPSPHWV